MDSLNLQEELKRELELNIEKEKLKDVISIIKEEILKYIEKRKEFSDYILDYRKKFIEEYRDDEDKLIEYFDHERYLKEETFKTIDRRLKELTILKSSPYFGRIEFSEEDYGIEKLYIGRFGLTPEETYEPVVVDWRAPVASLFYAGKLGDSSYEAPAGDIAVNILSKRQYIVKNEELKGMFDSEIDIKDDILQMVLSKNAGDKLKDIIMTIQKEQDDIIRHHRNKTIIVDGVAGSGKTTIALHIVAYLLYNYRKILEDKVLILGPNKIFIEYISNVLPELGETGVKQGTFSDFAEYILNIKDVMMYKDYMERILSGDREFINEMLYKTSDDYIKVLDDIIDEFDSNHFSAKEIILRDKVVLTKKEINDLFSVHYKHMPLFRRSKKIKRIIFSKIRDARDEMFRDIQKNYEETLNSLSSDERELHRNDLEFKRRLEIRGLIKDIIDLKKTFNWLNNPDILEIYNKLNDEKQLTQDDLAPILYLKIKLEGFRMDEEVKHVVIDEAQDYSKLQFIVVKEVTKCAALTILGDSNQRILPQNGELAMKSIDKILKDLDVEFFALNKSYRSTKEIMEYANSHLKEDKIVPLVRSGEEVTEKTLSTYEALSECLIDKIMRFREKGYESIAVITKDIVEGEKLHNSIKDKVHVRILDDENIIYHSGIIVVPSYFAKGLEFDAVIVIDHSETEEKNEKISYVMATRALHELCVYNIKN